MTLTEFTDAWREHTYGEALEQSKKIQYCTDAEYNMVYQILNDLNLYDKPMTGDTVEGFNFYEKENQPIQFTQSFDFTLKNTSPITHKVYFSPLTYIINMVRGCRRVHYTDIDLLETVVIPRGIRSFPSYLRELDLCKKLNSEIEGVKCRRSTPYEDAHYHIDIFMEYKGKSYLIWSYMYNNNPAKLQNLIDKITGVRTPIHEGTYMLCPFLREEKIEYNGWWFHTTNYIENIKTMLQNEEVDNYNDVIISNPNLGNYLRGFHIFKKF